MSRRFVVIASFLMFIGVGAGAFGAHSLAGYFDKYPDLLGTYETAVRYHMIHSLALLAVAWASDRWPAARLAPAGYLLLAGILLFSGSLYLLVFTQFSLLGAVAPLGGAAFLAGWLWLGVSIWRVEPRV